MLALSDPLEIPSFDRPARAGDPVGYGWRQDLPVSRDLVTFASILSVTSLLSLPEHNCLGALFQIVQTDHIPTPLPSNLSEAYGAASEQMLDLRHSPPQTSVIRAGSIIMD